MGGSAGESVPGCGLTLPPRLPWPSLGPQCRGRCDVTLQTGRGGLCIVRDLRVSDVETRFIPLGFTRGLLDLRNRRFGKSGIQWLSVAVRVRHPFPFAWTGSFPSSLSSPQERAFPAGAAVGSQVGLPGSDEPGLGHLPSQRLAPWPGLTLF